MANTSSATKRFHQAEKRRSRNMSMNSSMRTCIKKFLKLVESGSKAEAKSLYPSVVKKVDMMVTKKLIHLNKASRIKSRLNKKII